MSASPNAPAAARGRPRSLWLGIALVVIGILGFVLLAAVGSWSSPSITYAPVAAPVTNNGAQVFSSLGERIFLTGTDASGKVIPRSVPSMYGMMFGQTGCASCHGADGRGGTVAFMMGSFETHDIRWSSLTSEMADDDGETHPPYDEASFARAVREGIDPAGDRLDAPMPEWRLTDAELTALIDYLKSLQ